MRLFSSKFFRSLRSRVIFLIFYRFNTLFTIFLKILPTFWGKLWLKFFLPLPRRETMWRPCCQLFILTRARLGSVCFYNPYSISIFIQVYIIVNVTATLLDYNFIYSSYSQCPWFDSFIADVPTHFSLQVPFYNYLDPKYYGFYLVKNKKRNFQTIPCCYACCRTQGWTIRFLTIFVKLN